MYFWILILGWAEFGIIVFGTLLFITTSILEKRLRPVKVALFLFTPFLSLFLALLLLNFPAKSWILLGIILASTLGVLVFIFPTGSNPSIQIKGKQKQVDERDAIFHRFYRLKPNTPEFEEYYKTHPEKFEFDQKVRSLPDLGQPGSKTYDPLTSPFQIAMFEVLEKNIVPDIDWKPEPVESTPVHASPKEFTQRIKGFARYLGANLVGTTKLNPAYIYSHIGRSPGKWGAPITLNHSYAVAIGVEMRYEMIRHAPDNPVTTESAFKYIEAAKIAMVIARYINLLGYEARAHVDANYRVMCGPIAVDAGLGELGRLGLLITPEFGPRVRLSVVTTNLPLMQDKPISFGVQDFCSFCKKCAINCPSGAIDKGKKSIYKGVEKWQSNQEACYRFWRIQGSDCSLCIKVCPYSHPGTLLHNIVRKVIKRNHLARRAALIADNLFYGQKPQTKFPLPDWHKKSNTKKG